LKIAATVLSASTTVLLGLQSTDPAPASGAAESFRIAALICSAFVTVLGASEAFFDPRGLWVRYTVARARLIAVRARVRFAASGGKPLDDNAVREYFDAYEAILADLNEQWREMHPLSSPANPQRLPSGDAPRQSRANPGDPGDAGQS